VGGGEGGVESGVVGSWTRSYHEGVPSQKTSQRRDPKSGKEKNTLPIGKATRRRNMTCPRLSGGHETQKRKEGAPENCSKIFLNLHKPKPTNVPGSGCTGDFMVSDRNRQSNKA